MTDFDVDNYLKSQDNEFNQDQEVKRVLELAPKTKNPIEILELSDLIWTTYEIDDREIKSQFRQKSLMLHPDKCKHPQAQEAFDVVKQAESMIMNKENRAALIEALKEAKMTVDMRGNQDKRFYAKEGTSEYIVMMKLQVRTLIEQVQKRRELRHKNEVERLANIIKEEENEKKRKIDHEKKWEAGRESRVQGWRKFQKTGPKKKKGGV